MQPNAFCERPILFSAPMVRAILEGRKTQSRRIVKLQPEVWDDGTIDFGWAQFYPNGYVHTSNEEGYGGQNWNSSNYPTENKFAQALARTPHSKLCPFGRPGDRLWVRETHKFTVLEGWKKILISYASGGEHEVPSPSPIPCETKWRPSIHMPRWASRISLEVTSVRVERLKEITAADVLAEGVGNPDQKPGGLTNGFARQWGTLYGAGAWAANPWVWVIEFRRIQ
jgi:hypothetical protein